jgi:alkylated DNA repair dioxygenase AlkB
MSQTFSENASLIYYKNKIPCSKEEFETLVSRMPTRDQREIIKVHQYIGPIPRSQKLFGESTYTYSRIKLIPDLDIDPLVQRCIDFSNEEFPNWQFNGALVNLYENGQDNVGWHSDAEDTLVPDGPIVSFSFGFTRQFQVRTIPSKWNDKKKTWKWDLGNGDIAVMYGKDFQKILQHQVPKTSKKIPDSVDPRRINITVRPFKKKEEVKRQKVEEEI